MLSRRNSGRGEGMAEHMSCRPCSKFFICNNLLKQKQLPYGESIKHAKDNEEKQKRRLSWVVKGLKCKGQACLAQWTSRFRQEEILLEPPVHIRVPPCPLQDSTGPGPRHSSQCSLPSTTHCALSASGYCPSAPHGFPCCLQNDLCFPRALAPF